MAAAIDMLDNSWNPYESLGAMQDQRKQQSYQMYLEKHWGGFFQKRNQNRHSKLDRYIVLKRLGLEETLCIINGG